MSDSGIWTAEFEFGSREGEVSVVWEDRACGPTCRRELEGELGVVG